MEYTLTQGEDMERQKNTEIGFYRFLSIIDFFYIYKGNFYELF